MPTYCEACHRAYKQIKPHLKTKKHAKNTLLLQRQQEPQEIHECSICLDEISSDNLHTTQCGHHFHRDCINSWREMKNSCPNCRGILPPLQRPQQAAQAAQARAQARAQIAYQARQRAVVAAEFRQRARQRVVAAARQRERLIIQPNYNLINILLETIDLFEQFENMNPAVLNDARFRLMQLLN